MTDYPKYQHQIEFSDSSLDSFGKVSVADICDQIQIAATSHSKLLGVGMVDLQKGGITWMLTRMTICFDEWPKSHHDMVVSTWPSGVSGGLICHRDYDFVDLGGSRILRGTSDWVLVDVIQRKIVRLTPQLLTIAPKDVPRADVPPRERKPRDVSGERFSCELCVRRSDIDINHHVNNIHYVEWLFEPLSDELLSRRLLRFDIEYHAEARHGEAVVSEAVLCEDGKTVHHLRKKDGTLLTTAICHWE